jgi:hypothetical protein
VGDEAWNEQKVKRAVPDDLVGDVDLAALGISGLRWEARAFHGASFQPGQTKY